MVICKNCNEEIKGEVKFCEDCLMPVCNKCLSFKEETIICNLCWPDDNGCESCRYEFEDLSFQCTSCKQLFCDLCIESYYGTTYCFECYALLEGNLTFERERRRV